MTISPSVYTFIGLITVVSIIIGISVSLAATTGTIVTRVPVGNQTTNHTTPPPTGMLIVDSIRTTFSEVQRFPVPLSQNEAKRGPQSPCWHLEWIPQFAAYLQTHLQGTPRMNGNWSAMASEMMIEYQVNYAMGNSCDSNPLIYPPFPNRPITRINQDVIGGLYVNASFDVSVNGSDSNSGLRGTPFLTIQRAVLACKNVLTNQTCVIVCRQGTYYFSNPIYLSNVKNLILMGYPGEDVVWSGTRIFTPSWTPVSGKNFFVTAIPSQINATWAAFNELWAEGGHQVRARYPNGNMSARVAGDWTTGGAWGSTTPYIPATLTVVNNVRQVLSPYTSFQMGYNGTASIYSPPWSYWAIPVPYGGGAATHYLPTSFIYSAGIASRVATWTRMNYSYMHVTHCMNWGIWQFQLGAVNLATNNITLGVGGFQEARGCSRVDCTTCGGFSFFIDHQYAELDSPGEYYIDQTNRLLYYYPIGASPPTQVEVSQTPTLLVIENSINVTVSGITFTKTSNVFMEPHSAPGGGDWSCTRNSTIHINNCQNCTVVNTLITDIGGNGIGVHGTSNGTLIAFNEITHVSENAIAVMGDIFGYDAQLENTQPKDTVIKSNMLYHVGLQQKQAGQVFVALSYRTVVESNVMLKSPRSAINFQDGFAGGHVFAHNLLAGTGRETGDVGPFNTWNRVPYLTLNQQTNTYSWITSMSYAHHNLILVDLNEIPINDCGLNHDDGSNNWLDYSNVITNGRFKSNWGDNLQSFTNLIIPAIGNDPYLLAHASTSNLYINNTFLFIGLDADATAPLGYIWPDGIDISISGTYANNTYLTPAYKPLIFGYNAGVGLTLNQWQSISTPYTRALDIGSTQALLPSTYPYWRFMGPTLLGFNDSLAALYGSDHGSLPSSIRVSVAVSNSMVDSQGNTWGPMYCRDNCLVYGGALPTPPYNDATLFLRMHYNSVSNPFSYVYSVQNGSYNFTLLLLDITGGGNGRTANITVNGIRMFTNLNQNSIVSQKLAAPSPIIITDNVFSVTVSGFKAIMNGMSLIPS